MEEIIFGKIIITNFEPIYILHQYEKSIEDIKNEILNFISWIQMSRLLVFKTVLFNNERL